MKCTFIVLLLVCTAQPQIVTHPITQVEACKRFLDSVVKVDTDVMHGTGFIVDSNGWIITALHVVADREMLAGYGNITVTVAGHRQPIPANIMSPLDKLASARDFAVLKIDKTQLPHLELGSEDGIELGSPISIIGFPLAAILPIATAMPKFCLSGTVAAQTSFPLGNLNFLHTVYFQGVSIKGVSGAPIISLESGKVIGIVTTKLAGINKSLEEVENDINTIPHVEMGLGPGRGVVGSLGQVIDVLDTQLANGLGSGTGATDASYALKKAQRDYHGHSKQ